MTPAPETVGDDEALGAVGEAEVPEGAEVPGEPEVLADVCDPGLVGVPSPSPSRFMSSAAADTPAPAIAATSSAATSTLRVERLVSTVGDGASAGVGDGVGAGTGARGTSRWVGV